MNERATFIIGAVGLGIVALLFSRRSYAAPLAYTANEFASAQLPDGSVDIPDTFKPDDYDDSPVNIPQSDDAIAAESRRDVDSTDYGSDPWGLQTIYRFPTLYDGAYEEQWPTQDDSTQPSWMPAPEPAVEDSTMMNPSQLIVEVADYIMGKEGLRLFVYDDFNGKPWAESQRGKATIGYGHLLKPGEPLDWVVDESEAYQLLLQDVAAHLVPIIPAVHVPLSIQQWIAIADLAFNVGVNAVIRSSFLRSLNANDIAGAEAGYRAWNLVTVEIDGVKQKVVSNGLVNRRNAGWALFAQAQPVVYLA